MEATLFSLQTGYNAIELTSQIRSDAMYRFFKFVADFILSLTGILILSPVFAVLSLCVKCTSRGPVFFTQKRIGKDRRVFTLYKFRTMRVDTPNEVPTAELANPDGYVTPIGKFLRKTSLDELPQLLNVLGGHMSLVGPRPPLWNQTGLIEIRDKYGAHTVRPGITGWTQVNGREIPDREKAEMEGYYVEHMGLVLDLKILLMTVSEIFATKSPIMRKRKP